MILYLASATTEWETALSLAVHSSIPATKRQRIQRCVLSQQRVSMLLGEALLAWAIEREYGLKIRPQDRCEGRYGKPFLKSHSAKGSQGTVEDDGICHRAIEFNLSHSGPYVLLGLDEAPIGVDIQEHVPVDDRLASRVLPQSLYLRFRQASDPVMFFCDHWARRESELKWRGVGITGLREDYSPLPEGISVRDISGPIGFSAAVCARGLTDGAIEPYEVSVDSLF